MSSEGTVVRRVNQRGEVSYLLRYYIEDTETGQRRRVNVTVHVNSEKEAKRELRKLLTQVDDGNYVEPTKLTVSEWVDTWKRVHAASNLSAKTFERYSELLELHVKPHIGGIPIQKLATIHIDNLYAKLRTSGKKTKLSVDEGEEKGLSEQTILHVHRILYRVLSIATKKKVIGRNPAQDATAPRPRARKATGESKAICALDREQLKTLLVGLQGKELFVLVALAAGTGMRRGELLALRWPHIDFTQGKMRIEQSLEQTKAGVQFKEPKNRTSKRTIGVDQGLLSLLRDHWKGQAELYSRFGGEYPANALLFPKDPLTPLVPTKPESVSKKFAVVSRQLGFPFVRFHDLRHTHATLLLTAGVPVNAVATRLGHSTPVVTLSVYGHVIKQAEEQAVSVAGSLLEGTLV